MLYGYPRAELRSGAGASGSAVGNVGSREDQQQCGVVFGTRKAVRAEKDIAELGGR